jgi:hypothetical protein
VSDANTAGNQRGRPFPKGQSGNPAGKPKGARHRATLAAEVLLDGEAETLTRKAVELALGGNVLALRLCLDRILPPRRERAVTFALPEVRSAADATAAMASILASVAAGALTVAEAGELAKLVEAIIRGLDAAKEVERKESVNRLFPGLDFGSHPVR